MMNLISDFSGNHKALVDEEDDSDDGKSYKSLKNKQSVHDENENYWVEDIDL